MRLRTFLLAVIEEGGGYIRPEKRLMDHLDKHL